jgi:hypothetical protein
MLGSQIGFDNSRMTTHPAFVVHSRLTDIHSTSASEPLIGAFTICPSMPLLILFCLRDFLAHRARAFQESIGENQRRRILLSSEIQIEPSAATAGHANVQSGNESVRARLRIKMNAARAYLHGDVARRDHPKNFAGDPSGSRTRVPDVRGGGKGVRRCPNLVKPFSLRSA